MSQTAIRQCRWLVMVALLFVCYQHLERSRVLAMPPQCDEDVCISASVDCTEECGVGYDLMTCADYIAQSSSGQCDYGAWDTCNWVCGPTISGSTTCLDQGNSSTCESYGVYGSPNDGICAPGENCSNSSDCECPPSADPQMEEDILEEADQVTLASACTAAHIAANYGFISDPSQDCTNPIPNAWHDWSCDEKNAALSEASQVLNIMAALYSSPATSYALKSLIGELFDVVWNAYEQMQGMPCSVFFS